MESLTMDRSGFCRIVMRTIDNPHLPFLSISPVLHS